ncbi:PH domain-containing protein [Microbacterium sp. X-17]|uniref:PH domain-containing protein n=1 Tax=Microbacterium sp. X-17 TaxID=3144404 RepID=UPI0031F51CA2
MTQPTFAGRPLTPAPGVPVEELLIARVRQHPRRLFWSALVLIAVGGACGFFYGNLPEPLANWMLLTAAAVVILLLVLLPYVSWLSRTYTITTRRVIARSGLFVRRSTELTHVRGYTIAVRRGPLQRLWGIGTLRLSDGLGATFVIKDVADSALIHEVLVDQVEVSQILAHRDGQPPLPPQP